MALHKSLHSKNLFNSSDSVSLKISAIALLKTAQLLKFVLKFVYIKCHFGYQQFSIHFLVPILVWLFLMQCFGFICALFVLTQAWFAHLEI